MIDFPYKIRKSRLAKSLRLEISRADGVTLVVPNRVPLFLAKNFLLAKESWVKAKLAEQRSKKSDVFPTITPKEEKEARNNARRLIGERVNFFATILGLPVKTVAIRDQKTRWGSCSKEGNLNFNFRLIFINPELMDYVVVHELCHLKELNHSPKFWALVEKVLPDYRERRRILKRISL
ncbi:MAG: SprT family zinc-dependent metalloprotease [Candidatus Falkowbacteria bacterium]|nr:SprT family zinc-dependent metalloprotease [Candidatus Falkowbacteria bacterium]